MSFEDKEDKDFKQPDFPDLYKKLFKKEYKLDYICPHVWQEEYSFKVYSGSTTNEEPEYLKNIPTCINYRCILCGEGKTEYYHKNSGDKI